MTAGLCVCVLLVVLCTTCLGVPHTSRTRDQGHWPISPSTDALLRTDSHTASSVPHLRRVRSVSQLAEEDGDTRANLSELLARLISRKGSVRRNSAVNSRASGLSANHRIKDRDYLGWMDFGRRSAEEYEYSS